MSSITEHLYICINEASAQIHRAGPDEAGLHELPLTVTGNSHANTAVPQEAQDRLIRLHESDATQSADTS